MLIYKENYQFNIYIAKQRGKRSLRIHCGKNAAVDEKLSHVVNNLRNLWPVPSDPHTNRWQHKRK